MKYDDSDYLKTLVKIQRKVVAIQESHNKLMNLSVNFRRVMDNLPVDALAFDMHPNEFRSTTYKVLVSGYGIRGVGSHTRMYIITRHSGSVELVQDLVRPLDSACIDVASAMKYITMSEDTFKNKVVQETGNFYFQFMKALLNYMIGVQNE